MAQGKTSSGPTTACPVCSSKDATLEERHDEYALLSCNACGLGFCDPMRESQEFYEQSVDYIIRDQLIVDPLAWEKRWDIECFLSRQSGGGGRLLDVGCGTGFFVHKAQELGFDASGIETDARAVERGRSYFALETLYAGTLDEFLGKNPDSCFDVVTFFQVIEHLEDPASMLHTIRGLLSPGGILVLSLPYRGRWPDVLGEVDRPPHHLTRWSTDAVRILLERAGFSVGALIIENFPLHNMIGMVYQQVLRFMPSLTLAGHKKAEGPHEMKAVTQEMDMRLLKRRKLKMSLAMLGSSPLWAMLKLLGARGPHMYIEAIPASA